MRITSNMYYKNLYGTNNSKLTKDLFDVNKQIASGLKIEYAQDDVGVFSQTMRLDNELSSLNLVKKSTQSGSKVSDQTDMVLNEFDTTMDRMRTLLIDASNGTHSDTSLDAIADELEVLGEHLKNLSNTSINGQYLFSGTAVDTKPISDDGSYNGNDGALSAVLGSNTYQQYNISGSELFLGEEVLTKREISTNVSHINLTEKYDYETGEEKTTTNNIITADDTIRDLMGDNDSEIDDVNNKHHFYIRGVKSDGTAFKEKIDMKDNDKVDELLTKIGNAYGNTPNLQLVDVSLDPSGNIVIQDKQKGSSKLDFHMVGAVDFDHSEDTNGDGNSDDADVEDIDLLDGGETNFDEIMNPTNPPANNLYVKEFVKSGLTSASGAASNIDGLIYDRADFVKDGSKLSSNVAQILKDDNSFATGSTKLYDVADTSQVQNTNDAAVVHFTIDTQDISTDDIDSITYVDGDGTSTTLDTQSEIQDFIDNGVDLTIGADATQKPTVSIIPKDDSDFEVSEAFSGNISSVSGAAVNIDKAYAKINDEDSDLLGDKTDDTPVINLLSSDNTAVEGQSGDSILFKMEQSDLSSSDSVMHFDINEDDIDSDDIASITYVDGDGTSTTLNTQSEIQDFLDNGVDLTIEANTDQVPTVKIVPINDKSFETAESFNAKITNVSGSDIKVDTSYATIYDDDRDSAGDKLADKVDENSPFVNVFATDNTAVEGNGSDAVVFTIAIDDTNSKTLDGTSFDLVGTNINGVSYDFSINLNDSENGGSTFTDNVFGTSYTIFDMSDPRAAVDADEMTYQQLMDVVNMVVTDNLPASIDSADDYDKAITTSNLVGNTTLSYDGRIQFQDVNNSDTKASIALYDKNTDDFSDSASASVMAFNANNGLTLKDPKTDFFKTIDEIVTSVREYSLYPDSGDSAKRNIGIENSLGKLDDLQDHLSRVHSKVGAQSNALNTSLERTELLEISTMTLRSSTIDTDLAEASLELSQLNLNYEAMLSTVGKVSKLSLVNYL